MQKWHDFIKTQNLRLNKESGVLMLDETYHLSGIYFLRVDCYVMGTLLAHAQTPYSQSTYPLTPPPPPPHSKK